jgi:co-chaperonin GroES (HSP10)
LGELAYKDESKFPFGAWCKEGDWVIFGRYAGSRISIDGGEIRFLNDDEILGIVNDPEDILHM